MKQPVLCIISGLLTLVSITWPACAAPSDLIGYWATGKNEAVAQIYSCGHNLLCGELVGFPMDRATDPMPKTWENQPQCHFVFIRNVKDLGNSWNGMIINPRNGNSYRINLRIIAEYRLQLRGYVLLPLLGATRFWTRYEGPPPPPDCRMAAHSLD